MKALYEIVVFFAVLAAWVTTEWLSVQRHNVAFTLGVAVIFIGLAMERLSVAFIFLGTLICGLLILWRLMAFRAPARKEGSNV